MKFKTNRIMLDDLVLKPSNLYASAIEGLFDFDKSNDYADILSDGQIFHNSKINPKKITLNIYTKKPNDVMSHLKLNSVLSKKVIKLKVWVDGIGELNADVQVETKAMSNEYGGAISVVLTAGDPYLYGYTKTISLGITVGGGMKFPFKMPMIFGDRNSRKGVLVNGGTGSTFPIITISAPCDKFMLINKTTGQSNTIEPNLTGSDKLVIDCRPKSRGIKKNGIPLYIKQFDFYRCDLGGNEFEFVQYGSNMADYLNCKIEIQERFV